MKVKTFAICALAALAAAAEQEWSNEWEAERNCVSATRYGLEEKCYVCKGRGYLKRYRYGKPAKGRLGRGPRSERYVQCGACLKKKDKWEKAKLELERKEVLSRRAQELELAEEKRRWNEEQVEEKRLEAEERAREAKRLEDAAEGVRKAELDLELAEAAAEKAWPERLCEIHKWKDVYARGSAETTTPRTPRPSTPRTT